MFVVVNTKPNIFFALNVVAEFCVALQEIHCSIVEHVFKYLWSIVDYSMKFYAIATPHVLSF